MWREACACLFLFLEVKIMEINVYVSSLGAYNAGELTGQWTKLPVASVKEDIIDKINGAVGDEYFISDYEAPFKIGEDDSLENLNKLAKALNEENVGSLEDLYWKLREGIGTDDTVTQYTRYDDDSDLDQMLAGETPTQIINDLGPKFNLSDSYLYWENGYLNTATEQEFQADLKFMARDLINSFIDKYNSTYEDSISFIN